MTSSANDSSLRKYGEAFDFYAEGGSCLPNEYTVIDCETTGFSPAYDCMLQIAHTEVVKGKPHKRGMYVFNWLGYDYQKPAYVQQRLRKAAEQHEKVGRPFRFSAARLVTEGKDPRKIMEFYASKFQQMVKDNTCLVGHNIKFDLAMLLATAEFFPGLKLPLDQLRVVDTGSLVKLHQAGWQPEPGDTLPEFTRRTINRTAAGVKWSLTDFSIPHYLSDVLVDPAKAHEADYDVNMTYRLLERLRELGDQSPVTVKRQPANKPAPTEDSFMGEPIGSAAIGDAAKRSGVLPRKKTRRSA